MPYIHKSLGGEEPQKEELRYPTPGWHTFSAEKVFLDDRDGEPLVSTSGKQYAKLICEAEDEATIPLYLYLTAKSAWKLDQFLNAAGLLPEKGEQVSIDEELLKGAKFRGLVKEENGRYSIDKYEAPESDPF